MPLFCPSDGRDGSHWGGYGWFLSLRWLRVSTTRCRGSDWLKYCPHSGSPQQYAGLRSESQIRRRPRRAKDNVIGLTHVRAAARDWAQEEPPSAAGYRKRQDQTTFAVLFPHSVRRRVESTTVPETNRRNHPALSAVKLVRVKIARIDFRDRSGPRENFLMRARK